MSDSIGVTNAALYAGIPNPIIYWGTPGNQATASATACSASIFTRVNKSPDAEVSITKGNDNEIVKIRRSNKTWRLTFSAKPSANTLAGALAIEAAVPLKMDVVVVTCTSDSQLAGTSYVESVDVGYTPEGDAVVDFTLTKYTPTFVALS